MEYCQCHICLEKAATKSNSHLIPSFLIAPVCSYDQSGKRDKELLFTITSAGQQVYASGVPDSKLEEVFDTELLTEERIEQELKNNTAALDYIFCPECESRLSKWLEAPYSEKLRKQQPANGELAYMFWLSVFWRVSRFEQFVFRFSEEREEETRETLFRYFIAKEQGEDTSEIVRNCSFRYWIIQDEKVTPVGDQAIAGRYKDDVAVMFFGQYAVCATMGNTMPDSVDYCGFENIFVNALMHDGTGDEVISTVNHKDYIRAIDDYRKFYSYLVFQSECTQLNAIWTALGLPGEMPNELKAEYIRRLYDDNVKIGDRLVPQRKVQVLYQLFCEYFRLH